MDRRLAALAALLLALPARAIIVRDDVLDADYIVDDADWPALVTLFEPDDCLGTLVDPRHLLTVAHCAVDLEVGGTLDVAGTPYAIEAVRLHGRWRDRDTWDIAMVELETPVEGVLPLPIYRGDAERGAIVALLGRGLTATGLVGEEGASSDGRLRRATNVVVAVDDQNLELVFDRPGEPGVTDLEGVGASGDSGGPVLMDVDGEPVLVGLNSFGDGGDGGTGVGEYGAHDYQTRLSRFADWIDAVLAGRDPGDRRGCATVGASGGLAFGSAFARRRR